MPKTKKSESALHDWVHELPFQMQALLMTGMRGPDGCPKHNHAKSLVRYLRGAICKPAADWSGMNDNDFMWGEYDMFLGISYCFSNDHDKYPHHFIMHLIHCAEVIGYKHPNEVIRNNWNNFYVSFCKEFHMTPETEKEMDERLNDFGFGVK